MRRNGNKIFYIILLLITGGLLYLLAPIITPFLIGILLAYLVDPLVKKLQRLRIPRTLSVVIVFFMVAASIFFAILLLIPLLQEQFTNLIVAIPNTVNWLQESMLPWISQHFGVSGSLVDVKTLKSMLASHLSQTGNIVDSVVGIVVSSGFTMVELIVKIILIPVVTFYLLLDWDKVVKGVRNLIPRHVEPVLMKLTKECDEVLSAFFRGQLIVMLILCVLYSSGLAVIGLRVGIIIGLLSGILSIVPYLGFITGIIIASIAAYVQEGRLMFVWAVCLIFIVIHLLENMVLTPYFLGSKIGLHPVAVIFAVLAGGTLFGFLGVLLALPVAAVVMVWLRYLNKKYHSSELYKAE